MKETIKKSARSINSAGLSSAGKDDVIKNLKLEIVEMETKYKSLLKEKDDEIIALNKQLRQLKSTNDMLATNEEKIKIILRLYAQGNSIGRVHSLLNENMRIECSYEEVMNIVNKLNNKMLDGSLREYYLQELKIFKEEFEFDDESARINTIRQLDDSLAYWSLAFNKLSKTIVDESLEVDNIEEMKIIQAQINDITEKKTKLLKGLNHQESNITIQTKDESGIYSKEKTSQFLDMSNTTFTTVKMS